MNNIFNTLIIFTFSIHLNVSLYLNQTLRMNLDVTLYRDPDLDINTIQMRQATDNALRELSNEQDILNYIDSNDGIQLLTDYYFTNENDDSFEYFTIIDIFFEREDDFGRALNDLETIDTTTFVDTFEEKLRDQIWIITAPPSSLYINGVSINSMKITKIDTDDNTGSALFTFDTQQTSTTTVQPTSSPSTPRPTMDDQVQDTVIIYRDSGSDSSYSFDTEAPYWILLIFFLFLGCCCGCAFWYIVCVKYHDRVRSKMMTRLQMVQTRSNNSTPKAKRSSSKKDVKKAKKPKTRKSHSAGDEYQDGITSEGNEEDSYDEEAEERKRKKQRYIEHGSDDDSEKAERVFNQPYKKKQKKKRVQQQMDDEEESEDSIERIVNKKMSHRKTYEYSSSSSDGGRKKKPKKRNRNKKTGVVEPIRYDEDGKRKLTTKELMAQYKQKRMKGGDSIDLSYKVGGVHSPRHKKNKDKKMEFGDDGSDNGEAKEVEGTRDSEYEFDLSQEQTESSMSGVNHPHYKPEPKKPSERRPKLDKIKEKDKEKKNKNRHKKGDKDKISTPRKRGRDRASSSTKRARSKDRGSKRKSNNNDKNVRHNRSGTADFSGGRNKHGARRIKSDSGGLDRNRRNNKQRPVSARFDGGSTPGSFKGRTKGGDDVKYSKAMKRPQSAKPGMKIKIDGRNNKRKRHFDDEEDSDEDDESYSPEPVNNNNNGRRNDDYDDEETDSEYYD